MPCSNLARGVSLKRCRAWSAFLRGRGYEPMSWIFSAIFRWRARSAYMVCFSWFRFFSSSFIFCFCKNFRIPVILWIHLVIRSSTADYAKEQGSTIICVHALINKLHCFFLNTMIILGYSLIIIYFVCNTYSVSEFNVFICRCRCVK